MFFYCEAKTKEDVILDVNSLESFEKWWSDMNLGKWHGNDIRSLIELKKINSVKFRGFREGLWYEIPDFVWKDFEFDLEKFLYTQENPSLLFRLSAYYKGKEPMDFTIYRTENRKEES